LNDSEIRNRLAEVERIVTHHKTKIHGHPTPIVGGIPVPLAVKTDDNIPAVPQSRPEVHRFSVQCPPYAPPGAVAEDRGETPSP